MRKVIAGVVLAAMMVSTTYYPIYADYSIVELQDNYIGFDELEQIIHEYNSTVINNRYNMKDIQEIADNELEMNAPKSPVHESSSSSSGGPDAKTEKLIKEMQEQIEALTSQRNEYLSAGKAVEAATLNDQIISLKTQISSLESMSAVSSSMSSAMSDMSDVMTSSAGKSVNADISRLQFNQIEDQLVKSAQSMFPTYYKLQYNLEQLKKNRELLELTYQATVKQLELGMTTQDAVDQAEANITNLDSSIASIEGQMETIKQELCKLLGKNFSADITIGTLPALDWDYINAINLPEDLSKVNSKNYDVLIQQYKVNDLGPGSTHDKIIAGNELESKQEAARSIISQKYQTLMDKVSAYQVQEQKMTLMEETINQIELKYSLGMVSKLEYESKMMDYNTQAIELKTAECDIITALNDYKWSLYGL